MVSFPISGLNSKSHHNYFFLEGAFLAAFGATFLAAVAGACFFDVAIIWQY